MLMISGSYPPRNAETLNSLALVDVAGDGGDAVGGLVVLLDRPLGGELDRPDGDGCAVGVEPLEALGGGQDPGVVEPLLEGLLEAEHGVVVGDLDLEGERGRRAGDDRGVHGSSPSGEDRKLPQQQGLSLHHSSVEPRSIEHYANARAITGRAGLFPSRYPSDRVDRSDGPLVRGGNRSLRQAILMIADNLIRCNDHFRGLAAGWRAAGKDPRDTHVKVGSRFCRIAYQMVAGRQVYRHPSCQHRSFVLRKLIEFHREHVTAMSQVMADLDAAAGQVPRDQHRSEAEPLVALMSQARRARTGGIRRLGEVLPEVLARLGVHRLESSSSGEADPT